MSKRFFAHLTLALALYASPALAEQSGPKSIDVWKSPTCGCCGNWVKHMDHSGYAVKTKNVEYEILVKIKKQAGIAPDLQSCHTAKVGGYIIEGHVPAEDVKRLLAEKPDAIGLAVPGMPVGSPGMEMGNEKEPYEVLLVKKDGSTEVFAKH